MYIYTYICVVLGVKGSGLSFIDCYSSTFCSLVSSNKWSLFAILFFSFHMEDTVLVSYFMYSCVLSQQTYLDMFFFPYTFRLIRQIRLKNASVSQQCREITDTQKV